LCAVVRYSSGVLDFNGVGFAVYQGKGHIPEEGGAGQSALNDADGLQVVCASILESEGDGSRSVSPGEVEGFAGGNFTERTGRVGELDSLCDSESCGGGNELGELHFG